jgi:flagellar basal body-associated protein FliL
MKLNSSTFVFFVILQVVLAFTFITVFFFTYGKTLEKQAIMNNIDYLIENILGSGTINLPDTMKTQIINKINGNTGNSNNEEDKEVKEKNKKIFKNSMIILLIILLLVILLFVFFMSMRNSSIPFFQNFEFIKIFKESFVILIFVGLTEFCFMYFFGSKYIVIEPNLLKKQVVDQLNEYSNY